MTITSKIVMIVFIAVIHDITSIVIISYGSPWWIIMAKLLNINNV